MDDTTRGVGPGDDFSGRRDEEMRSRATTERSTTTRSTANPAAETRAPGLPTIRRLTVG